LKKNYLLIILILIFIFLCTVGVASCNHKHTYSEDWTSDETYHWHKATCEHSKEISGKAEHKFNTENVCICGREKSIEQKYTVKYNANGGHFDNGNNEVVQNDILENSILTEPARPIRENYNFSGWSTAINGSDFWNFVTDKITDNITLYAIWTQESAVILSIDGAIINDKTIYMFVDNTVDSVSLSNNVICSQNSIWKLYYDKLGQIEIPTKIAASKNGELEDGNNIFYIVVSSLDGTVTNVYMLTIYRSYAVSVTYYDGNTPIKRETVYTGYEFCVEYIPNIQGYTFNKWNTVDGVEFTSEIIWSPLALYADKDAQKYTITYDFNGGNSISESNKELTYGQEYSLPIVTRMGYTFIGWYIEDTPITDEYGKSLKAWSHAENKIATAKWKINRYNVTVKANNSNAGSVSGGGVYDYNSNVTLHAITNSGYIFLGWYNGVEIITNELSCTITLGISDMIYTAIWTRVLIDGVINGETDSKLLSVITLGDDVVFKVNSIYLGYDFIGWYDDNILLTKELSFQFNLNKLKSTYIAKFKVKEEMENFYFNSTVMDCNITGTKNQAISEIIVPDYVTSIGESAFGNCNKLTSITIPFVGNSKNEKNNTHFGYIFGASSYEFNREYIPTSLKIVDITGAVSINDGAFANCAELTNIIIPNSVTSIGEYAFNGCSSLTSVKIPDSVTSIGSYAFANCSSLTSVAIPDSITSIGDYAFALCTSMHSITLSDNITIIGEAAFNFCHNLTSIIIPNNVKVIGDYAFGGCHKLVEVYNLSSLNIVAGSEDNGYVGYYAKVIHTSIDEEGIIDIIEDGYMFIEEKGTNYLIGYNGKNTELILPDTYNGKSYVIEYAFIFCINLTSITIPDSVTSIRSYAYYGCSSLISITIGKGVTSIVANAFDGCSKLSKVYYKGTSVEWSKININDSDDYDLYLTNATRYYYSEVEPTDTDNKYWHYAEDGVTVVEW